MNQLCAYRSVSGIFLLTALCGLFPALPTHAEEDVRRATPPPGKVLLFVFRIDPQPVAVQVPVIVNTVLVGGLANGTFLTTTVSPGRNYLQIGDRAPSTLDVAANQSYFVRVRAFGDPRLVRSEVQLVSEAEGRRLLAQTRFVGVAPAATALRPPPAAPTAAPSPKPSPAAITAEAPPKPLPAPVTAAAPPKPSPAATQPTVGPAISTPTKPGRDWDFALIARAGTFNIANGNQVIAGFASTFDTASKSVFGVEAEWRKKSGIAVGGELFHYNNDLPSSGSIPNAQQEVLAIMVNAKYYFRVANSFYPFVGAGVGQAHASYSGSFKGNATGLAYQGLAGMEFRFNRIGVNVQYRYLDSTTGDAGKEVKVGGSGVLAGVSIVF